MTLTLQQVEAVEQVEKLSPSPNHNVHQSKSAPDLKGVWSLRDQFTNRTLPEGRGESFINKLGTLVIIIVSLQSFGCPKVIILSVHVYIHNKLCHRSIYGYMLWLVTFDFENSH